MSVVYQLRKIYGSKRPGYRLLIFYELQRLRYRSITSSSIMTLTLKNIDFPTLPIYKTHPKTIIIYAKCWDVDKTILPK